MLQGAVVPMMMMMMKLHPSDLHHVYEVLIRWQRETGFIWACNLGERRSLKVSKWI